MLTQCSHNVHTMFAFTHTRALINFATVRLQRHFKSMYVVICVYVAMRVKLLMCFVSNIATYTHMTTSYVRSLHCVNIHTMFTQIVWTLCERIFTQSSHNLHTIFTQSSHNIHTIFTQSSRNVHAQFLIHLFTQCWHKVHKQFPHTHQVRDHRFADAAEIMPERALLVLNNSKGIYVCVHTHVQSLTLYLFTPVCIHPCDFLQKSPIISGSFAERDLQLKASLYVEECVECIYLYLCVHTCVISCERAL